MKRCAYCGRENVDEATRCCECGTENLRPVDDPSAQAHAQRLNPQRDQSLPARLLEKFGILSQAEMEKEFVTLVKCGTVPEADMIVSDLEDAGITAFVPEQFAMQNFGFSIAPGYLRVQVTPADYAAARELIAATGLEATEETPPALPG